MTFCFFVSKGLGIEGIYRIPGKAMEILEIKKQFDSGKREGRERERYNVHVMVGYTYLHTRKVYITRK